MSRNHRQKQYAERARDREIQTKPRTAADLRGNDHADAASGKEHGPAAVKSDYWKKYKQEKQALLPERLPPPPGKRLVRVYVEGYEDVSFWRGIFDDYETDRISFEISVPPREDLAKGKKVILSMIPEASPDILLCVDSDFDYLFGHSTIQSSMVNSSPYLFHTYAYATENFLCYGPSLHNICVKATKNDTRIFDFQGFLTEYSRIIHPLFIWYAYSARLENENLFTLLEFKSSVKLNYLEVENNGTATLAWLRRQVDKRLAILRRNSPGLEKDLAEFTDNLSKRGLKPENAYMFMQGHTLLDNVVMIMLNAVCEQLKLMSNIRITTSTKTGVALKNELSNYNNALRNVRDILLDNESYKECSLYEGLKKDIERYIASLK